MATYLPEEMLVKIFSWLPPKSLIRFKCVSKRWHALIGNPDFLSKNLLNHSILTQNPCDPRGLTLFIARDKSDPCKRIHSFRSYDSLCCASQTPLDFPPEPPHLYVVASCNGLLCLSDEMGSNLCLWNPATSSDLKAIPASPSCCRAEPSAARDDLGFHLVGFGFDSVSNDFKVVTLVDEDEDGYLEAKMYSLRSGCWRLLDMCVNFELHLVPQGAALDGVFLWHVEDADGDYMNNRIVAFDFREEKFVTMPTPEATYSYGYTWALAELKGSLAMFVFPKCDRRKKMYLDIWVMLEFGVSESWTRLLSTDLPWHLERPLGFWKNGELFMENRDGQLVLYDFLSQTETNLQFQGRPRTLKVVDCNFVQFEGMGSGVIPIPSSSSQLCYTNFNDHIDCRIKQRKIYRKLEETQASLRGTRASLQETRTSLRGTRISLQETRTSLQETQISLQATQSLLRFVQEYTLNMEEGMLKMQEKIDMLMALVRRPGVNFGGVNFGGNPSEGNL